jgi:hypothetical protein
MVDPTVRWSEGVTRIRKLLMEMLRRSDEFRQPIAEIVDLLDELDDGLRPLLPSRQPRQGLARGVARYKPKSYAIEKRGRDALLVEYREGGRQPFCCPKQIHDAIAAAIDSLGRPAQFGELLAVTGKRLKLVPAEYLVRTCLRFWQSVDPPLVRKDRTYYGATGQAKFENAARRAWRTLAKQDA